GQRIGNQVIKKIPKGVESQFSDSQYGNVFMSLVDPVRKKLLSQFNDDRMDGAVAAIMNQADKITRTTFYGRIESEIGVSAKEAIARESIKPTTNALIIETQLWAKD